jgi:hypothetical protein
MHPIRPTGTRYAIDDLSGARLQTSDNLLQGTEGE